MSSLIGTESLSSRREDRSRRLGASIRRRGWPSLGVTGTLRGRLVVILTVANFLALSLTGSVIVVKARGASKLEIDSSMRVAGLLVTDTIRLMNEAPTSLLLQTMALQFQAVRHVRIVVADGDGTPVGAGAHGPVAQDAAAPEWFGRLVSPPPRIEAMPILRHDRLVGTVTIYSQPADEIDEAWNYAEPLMVAGSALNMAAAVALFLLYGRVLAPLAALAGGLEALQSKRYGLRLPLPALRELASLTDHFNRTAQVLADAGESNRVLHRKLLTAQDDERRRLALELHDEVGPCLFALDADASSIVASSEGGDARIHQRAARVVALIRQVKSINRRVLDQLRPIGLGNMALRESLDKLLLDFGEHPRIETCIGRLAESYGPVVDLTLYRCVQEGLFNAVRHAEATRISCEIVERCDAVSGRSLRICIEDDGKGLSEKPRAGIGLAGMRERVEALNGRLELASPGQGTRLTIVVPAGEAEARVS